MLTPDARPVPSLTCISEQSRTGCSSRNELFPLLRICAAAGNKRPWLRTANRNSPPIAASAQSSSASYRNGVVNYCLMAITVGCLDSEVAVAGDLVEGHEWHTRDSARRRVKAQALLKEF